MIQIGRADLVMGQLSYRSLRDVNAIVMRSGWHKPVFRPVDSRDRIVNVNDFGALRDDSFFTGQSTGLSDAEFLISVSG